MAHLNDVVTPSRVTRVEVEYDTKERIWPNGRRTSKRVWANPVHTFHVEWDGISLTAFNALRDHFKSNFGKWGVFTFTDPHDGVTYNVSYDDDVLDRRNVRRNVRGLYEVRIRLREDK